MTLDALLTIDFITSMSLLALLLVTGFAIMQCKDLLVNTILLSIFSLLMAAVYLTLSAPDVAITEAAVGAGISTILFLSALLIVGNVERKYHGNQVVPILVVLVTTVMLFFTALEMPSFGNPFNAIHQHVAPYYLSVSGDEIGIPNVVTSILASYRGFDTLGEVFVIFTAGISIILLLGDDMKKVVANLKKKS